MKQRMLRPIFAAALSTFLLSGCAGSGDSMSTSSSSDSATMSETQTMGGRADMEENMSAETDVVLVDKVDYDNMFSDISDTKQYNLIALAKKSPNLSTFVTLIEAAGLTDRLMGVDNYTLFAPTNEAFSSMPKEKLDMLLKPENRSELMKVIQLHVMPNEVASTQLSNNDRIKAGTDKYIIINKSLSNDVTIGGATVVRPDIKASNGVIHVVDGIVTSTDKPNKY
jgi:uncharacterized surface protein with fasciclin (FAS1) repeats